MLPGTQSYPAVNTGVPPTPTLPRGVTYIGDWNNGNDRSLNFGSLDTNRYIIVVTSRSNDSSMSDPSTPKLTNASLALSYTNSGSRGGLNYKLGVWLFKANGTSGNLSNLGITGKTTVWSITGITPTGRTNSGATPADITKNTSNNGFTITISGVPFLGNNNQPLRATGVNNYFDSSANSGERMQVHGIDNFTDGSNTRYRGQIDLVNNGSWSDMTQIEAVNIKCNSP